MPTLLFTFDNEELRDRFMNMVRVTLETTRIDPVSHKSLTKSYVEAIKDPKIRDDKDKIVGLFVAGYKLKEDSLPVIEKMFDAETIAHSGSVEIKELVDNKWKIIRSRLARKK